MGEILTSKKQRIMMRHAVGISNGNRIQRNYYCASKGCDGFDDLLVLVEMGLMAKHQSSISKDFVFHVTRKGKEEIFDAVVDH